MDERHHNLVPAIVTILALLLTSYVGCYYAMVEPAYMTLSQMIDSRPVAGYSIGGHSLGSTTAFLFGPAHWLDRRIRPGYWQPSDQSPIDSRSDP